ncbi:MAG: 3-methyl-2-oxobutanoate hydroxymethyltransferase [Candidatus Latescibacterota bacterium]|nr:3-methyl-2-oxobutanoate hydroxymethyltransferase [Candidatus Latescibacterota bacterium]
MPDSGRGGGRGEKTIALQAMKGAGEKIAVLTCYDYPTAVWQEEAGVDVIFVADSVGTNMLGYGDEREVTMEDMIHHLKAVRRGVKHTYLLADMPFGSCDTPDAAVENALRFVDLGADGVKLEGYKVEAFEALALRGVDTWAHLGLNPQIHHKRRLKARTALAAARVVKRARSLQEAGASFLVLELIPEEVGDLVTRRLTIPTIGIAAGRLTDGQVLVVTDVLGMGDREFRHVTRYTDFSVDGREALRRYVADVREGRFPGERHVGHLSAEERASLESGVMEEE